ncbi:MAG: STAS/SEC14 domain-containing protein [Candidatus Obscuribacterales bacterium]|nr:STAS/SEC14 domain-containing protein [Candidatus Obscuribacterales bacterium]
MIELREYPENAILEAVVDGYVSAEEYHEVAEKTLAFIEKHGRIRVMKEIHSFSGMDFSAFKDKLVAALLKHLNDVIAVAVVTDEKWIQDLSNLLKSFYPYKMRCFKLTEIEEARVWLKEQQLRD